jgi:hypothetical protein
MSTKAKNVREQAKQDKQREEGAHRGERNEEKTAHPRQKNGEDPDLAWIKIIDDAILAAHCAAFQPESRRDVLHDSVHSRSQTVG